MITEPLKNMISRLCLGQQHHQISQGLNPANLKAFFMIFCLTCV